MSEVVNKVIVNVLTAFYQPFGFAIVTSVLFMFFAMYAKESGLKQICSKWWKSFTTNIMFRRTFYVVFYVVMILFKTLLNRSMWANPISNVFGSWWIYNANGELTTEAIENVLLFIPFSFLWLNCINTNKESVNLIHCIGKTSCLSLVFSIGIEFTQLLLRLGTFQLSDLFFNTLGGLIGGLLYAFYKMIKK